MAEILIDLECESCGATEAVWVQTATATWHDPAEYMAICDDCAERGQEEHERDEALLEDRWEREREERRHA